MGSSPIAGTQTVRVGSIGTVAPSQGAILARDLRVRVSHSHQQINRNNARVVKLADTPDLGSGAYGVVGSTPTLGTKFSFRYV